MVDVGEDANVSNAISGMLKLDELLGRDYGHGESVMRRAGWWFEGFVQSINLGSSVMTMFRPGVSDLSFDDGSRRHAR